MIEKIINKKRSDYAIFFNEKGEQIDLIKIEVAKNTFKYKQGKYIKDKDKFSHIDIGFKTYFLYDIKFSNPIDINHKSDNKFIAGQIYSIVESNILKDVNRLENTIFSNLDSKKVIIILAFVIGFIYFMFGG